jgi:DNA-binding FadR family transcriptional regulator
VGEVRAAVIRAHRAITDAIVQGDADAAKRRMERHLRAYADSVSAEAEAVDIG